MNNTIAVKEAFEILDKVPESDYVLIQPRQPVTDVPEHSPAWRVIYADKVAELFERRSPHAAALPQ